METKLLPVYMFKNGTRIDLRKIISIGAIERGETYNWEVKVFCTGYNKPIVFIIGTSIGLCTPEEKIKIQENYAGLVEAWENYVNQKDK